MKVVFTHPTGNANAKAAVMGLMEANMLSAFQTSIASFKGDWLDNLGNLTPFVEIRRRNFDLSLKPLSKTWPFREVGRLIASKTGLKSLIKHEEGIFSIDAVYNTFDKDVASSLKKLSQKGAQAVYSYEDSALSSFHEARKNGLKCFYDLPIGYWRAAKQLLEIEQERWPEWKATLTGFKDSDSKLSRKDEELLLADKIFVASRFTAKTLQYYPSLLAPIKVIPYGFPEVTTNPNFNKVYKNRPLQLLFVGGLSQRKGIANLFAAVDALGDSVKLTIVGNKLNNDCPALESALSKHKWIPSMAHSDILKVMKEHDVLVFPSLFEGFGLVITEAMSQGTPVITTDRTAGPDLITNGENGWLIEAGSTEAIINSIEKILHKPEILIRVGRAAINTAKLRPWKVYGIELAQELNRK
jgi:glycosyltransferase involved in cell wall biosynthesis